MLRHWLFKTEPDTYSIDDLARETTCPWDGIRNYQARNRLRDEVALADPVLIYHSSCATPAIVGLARVVGAAEPDPAQFDPASPYHDARSDPAAPRWLMVSLHWQQTFRQPLTLREIKQDVFFADMELVTRSRLSIQHVAAHHFKAIVSRCQ